MRGNKKILCVALLISLCTIASAQFNCIMGAAGTAGSGGGSMGDYSPWDTTSTAIIQKDTTLNVGIGTTTPVAKLHVRDGSWELVITEGVFYAGDTFQTHNVNVQDSSASLKVQTFDIRNWVQINSNDSTELSMEVGQEGTDGTHWAETHYTSDKSAGTGVITHHVNAGALTERILTMRASGSTFILTPNSGAETLQIDSTIKLTDLAGSGTRLVTASATGVLGDTTFSAVASQWTTFNDSSIAFIANGDTLLIALDNGLSFISGGSSVTIGDILNSQNFIFIENNSDGIQFKLANASVATFDGTNVAGQTRFILYDVDNGQMERVTVGAADSGGAGFKVLRIPN